MFQFNKIKIITLFILICCKIQIYGKNIDLKEDIIEKTKKSTSNLENLDFSFLTDVMPPPIMIFQRGCSQSTWVTNTTMGLLNYFDILTYSEEYEALKPHKNRFYDKKTDNMPKAMLDFYRYIQTNHSGSWWVFKGSQGHLTSDIVYILKKLNTKVLNVYRSNVIDKLACDIRDCFKGNYNVNGINANSNSNIDKLNKIKKLKSLKRSMKNKLNNMNNKDSIGYNVDEFGDISDECFQRRFMNNSTNKAYINVQNLPKALDQGFRAGQFQETFLKKLNFNNFPTIKTEDLTSYEYGGFHGLAVSTTAWKYLLANIGVGLDQPKQIVEKKINLFLQKNGYGDLKLKSQRETIYNYNEVKNTVEEYKNGKYAHLLRDKIDTSQLGKKFVNSL